VKHARIQGLLIAALIGLNGMALTGCAVPDGSQAYYSTDLRIGLDYYDPWFGDYGGWGPGYRVGPPRQIMRLPDPGHDRRPPRGFRPAPGSRPIPSIPSRPHPRGPRPPR
jgi:hypothetical protein